MRLSPFYRFFLTIERLAWVIGTLSVLFTLCPVVLLLNHVVPLGVYLLAGGLAAIVASVLLGLAARRCAAAIHKMIEADIDNARSIDPASPALRITWIRHRVSKVVSALSWLLFLLALVGNTLVYSEFKAHGLAIALAAAALALLAALLRPVVWLASPSEGVQERLDGFREETGFETGLKRFPWATASVVVLGFSLVCAPALINASAGKDALKPTGILTGLSYLLLNGPDIVANLVASYQESGFYGNARLLVCAGFLIPAAPAAVFALFALVYVIAHEWPVGADEKSNKERRAQLLSAKRGFVCFALLLLPVLILGYADVSIIPVAAITYLHWLIVMSVVTVLVFAVDKYCAIEREWRTPESHLHVCAFLGG